MLQRAPQVVESFLGRTTCATGMVRGHVDHQPFQIGDVTPQLLDAAGHEVNVRTSPTTTMASRATATRMNAV